MTVQYAALGNVVCVRDADEPLLLFKARARETARELGASVVTFTGDLESIEQVDAAEDGPVDDETIGQSAMG